MTYCNLPVIIQARMGSKRLPGKVLLPLGREKRSILDHVIDRCLTISPNVCVATTELAHDDEIYRHALSRGVLACRGSEDNVWLRFRQALAVYRGATYFFRVTADCPLLVPALAKVLLDKISPSNAFLGVSHTVVGGISPELIHTNTFKELSHTYNLSKHDLEHVTPAMPGYATARIVPPPEYVGNESLEVNTHDDYKRLQGIFKSHVTPNVALVIQELRQSQGAIVPK